MTFKSTLKVSSIEIFLPFNVFNKSIKFDEKFNVSARLSFNFLERELKVDSGSGTLHFRIIKLDAITDFSTAVLLF